jgi:hypothetical protein
MKGLRLSFKGEERIFFPDGSVAVMTDGEPKVVGAWRSQSLADDDKDNCIRYDIRGVQQEPVPVQYGFNDSNQLTATIADPSAASEEVGTPVTVTILGQIAIDDLHDIVYKMVDHEGRLTGRQIVIYGSLSFNEAGDKLVIDLVGDGQAEIKGQDPIASIEALRNNNRREFRGDDLLRFNALTYNDVGGAPFPKSYPAEINLTGEWDIQGGQVVFVSKVKGDPRKPDVVVGLAGRFKGISAGLAYMVDKDGEEQIAFQIEGKHTWNSGDASWSCSLGWSDRKFTGKILGDLETKTKSGNRLVMSGSLEIEKDEDAPLQLDLDLKVSYDWKDGNIIFSADVSTENERLNYDLALEGTYKFKSGKLTFAIVYSDRDDARSATVSLAASGNRDDLKWSLSVLLEVDEDQIDLEIYFSIKVKWENGVRVKSEPSALAA